MTMSNPPQRRWYQFSLRTLFVLLFLVAAFCGWRVYRARENRERVAAVEQAIAEILKLGGGVGSKYVELRPATWLEELFDDPGGPDDPVGVLDVSHVKLYGVEITDAGLEHLKGLTNLEVLGLDDANITDAGLRRLKGLTNLKWLYLDDTKITNAGLKHLEGLHNLRLLYLDDTKRHRRGALISSSGRCRTARLVISRMPPRRLAKPTREM